MSYQSIQEANDIESLDLLLAEHVSGAENGMSGSGAGADGSGAVSGLNRPFTVRSNLTID